MSHHLTSDLLGFAKAIKLILKEHDCDPKCAVCLQLRAIMDVIKELRPALDNVSTD